MAYEQQMSCLSTIGSWNSQRIGEVLVASQVQHPLAAPAPENRGHAQARGHGATFCRV